MSNGQPRWAGVDWGDQSHALVVVDAAGTPVVSTTVPHSAEGLEELVAVLREHGPIAGVAVERRRHLVVDKLLEAAVPVYPINPKVSKAWREHLKVDPPKDDAGDAFSLAYHVRLHHEQFHVLEPDGPQTRTLRLLCADEQRTIADRTAKANQLKDCLKQYYPEALAWFPKFTTPTAADFVLAFPTHDALAAASDEELIAFLRTHHIGLGAAWTCRLAARHAGPPWPHDPATGAAKSLRATTLARQLHALHESLAEYRERIETLFGQQPDAALFASLPGAGAKLAPRLLSHVGTDRTRHPDATALQTLSGTVPLTKRSGTVVRTRFRWACQKDFRNTVFLFAFSSLTRSVWARAFYDRARARGQSHALALRNLGARWLKIIHRLWHDRTFYDERIYLASLHRHGSPLIDHITTSEKCQEILQKHLT